MKKTKMENLVKGVVTYNAFLDDFSATGDGIACMENNRIRVIANSTA
jgi:hypothetical protein